MFGIADIIEQILISLLYLLAAAWDLKEYIFTFMVCRWIYWWIYDHFSKKRGAVPCELRDVRLHIGEGVCPCPRCDRETLHVVNSIATGECVHLRFKMRRYCPRCEAEGPIEWLYQRAIGIWDHKTGGGLDMDIAIPIKTYGTCYRAAEAASTAAKGAEFRPHGTFIHHLSLAKDTERNKISMLTWFPFVLNLQWKGWASLSFSTVSSNLATEVVADSRRLAGVGHDYLKWSKRITPVLKRLRKLREDEKLTADGQLLLRKKNEAIRFAIGRRMQEQQTDDIFDLGYVELDGPPPKIIEAESDSESEAASDSTHRENSRMIDALEADLAQLRASFTRRMEEFESENSSLRRRIEEMELPELESISDPHLDAEPDTPQVAFPPSYGRDELLAYRSQEGESHISVAGRTERRALRLRRRNSGASHTS